MITKAGQNARENDLKARRKVLQESQLTLPTPLPETNVLPTEQTCKRVHDNILPLSDDLIFYIINSGRTRVACTFFDCIFGQDSTSSHIHSSTMDRNACLLHAKNGEGITLLDKTPDREKDQKLWTMVWSRPKHSLLRMVSNG